MSRVLVNLQDGQELGGEVDRFDAALPGFTLRPDDGVARRLRFLDVRSVAFLSEDGAPPTSESKGDQLVTLRYFDGGSVRGVLAGGDGQRRGVHLRPIGSGSIVGLYIPISAIQDVVSVESLGKILEREDMVSPDAIEAAVSRQRQLRSQRLGEILKDQGVVHDAEIAKAVELQHQAPGKRIGDILLDLGFVNQEQLGVAIQVQIMLRDKRLGEVLIDMGFADHKTIAIALSLQFHVPFVTVAPESIDPDLRTVIPAAFARQWRVLPLTLKRGVLTAAIADPTRLDFKSELRRRSGMVIAEVIATPADVERGLAAFYRLA
ncbi:MAG: hypothetical protein ABI609_02160 [Acidobacteriota bacterium]